jgi:hypothetical protein
MVKTLEVLQTINISYREILTDEDPWIALGNFMNDFFGNYPDRRAELVCEPLQVPMYVTLYEHRWAVFCAATVEHLCQKYELACPAWVHDPAYSLAEPWYHTMAVNKPHVLARLERETPEPFARRNIYCGNRMFINKYELAAERLHLQSA